MGDNIEMMDDIHLIWENEWVVAVRSLAIKSGLNIKSKGNFSRFPILSPLAISLIVSGLSRICLQSCGWSTTMTHKKDFIINIGE